MTVAQRIAVTFLFFYLPKIRSASSTLFPEAKYFVRRRFPLGARTDTDALSLRSFTSAPRRHSWLPAARIQSFSHDTRKHDTDERAQLFPFSVIKR